MPLAIIDLNYLLLLLLLYNSFSIVNNNFCYYRYKTDNILFFHSFI